MNDFFNTPINFGLNLQQVQERKTKYGQNLIHGYEASRLNIFLRQFNSFIYLLLAASLISFIIHDAINAIIILIITSINILIGFIQEYRAENELIILKKHLTILTTVIRDGNELEIDSIDLVPGDIVILSAGNYVPADMKILENSSNLKIDESSLTGESEPVEKNSEPDKNLIFMGSLVSSGKATGVVTAIGNETKFGFISQLTLQTISESNFGKNITALSKVIIYINIITLVCILIINILIKWPNVDFIELFMFSVALAVSVTPTALPVISAISLSRGAVKLAHNHVILRRLTALEDFGSITVLCTDKTGTLTENNLKVEQTYVAKTRENLDPVFYATLASEDYLKKSSNNFDIAVYNYLSDEKKSSLKNYKKINSVLFDPILKRNVVIVQNNQELIQIARGALENILQICKPIDSVESDQITKWQMEQENLSRRVLAICYKNISNINEPVSGMNFLGLISFDDPIKPTSYEAINKAKQLGINIKMITGDSKEVAQSVAKQIGLSPVEAISGLDFDNMSDDQKFKTAQSFSVFARFAPEQKYKLVEILKQNNIVGFLGEGINDAPALKAADVSIVVKEASDIAKDTADIILERKSLLVIINGISLGRTVFANTVKYIRTTLGSNLGNFYSIALISLFIDYLPLLPLQILFLDLLSDFPMISLSTDYVDISELRQPKKYNINQIVLSSAIFGVISCIFDFIFFAVFSGFGVPILRTSWFLESLLTELCFIFSMRTNKIFFLTKRPSLILMSLAILSVFLAIGAIYSSFGQAVFKFVSLNSQQIFFILLITMFYFIVTELFKYFYFYKDLNKK